MNARAVLVALVAAAALARLAPLALSPLPHNVDGFAGARVAEDLLAGAGLDPASYEATMPGAWALLAAFSALSGVPPLLAAQPLFALLGAASVLAGAALASRVFDETAGVVAAAFLAFYGFFVFYTGSVLKETAGLLLFPASILLFASSDARRRGLGAAIAAVVCVFHHLTAVVLLAALTVVAAAPFAARAGRWTDAALVAALWALSLAYFGTRAALRDFLSLLTIDAVLFGAVLLLAALIAAYLAANPRRERGRAVALAALPLAAAAVAAATALRPLFPLTIPLPTGALPYVAVAGVALAGGAVGLARVVAAGSRASVLALALLAGPLVFLAFSLLRGLDLASFNLVHRSLDYLDFAAALGLAALAAVPRTRPVAAALVALSAVTAAYALAGPAAFPVDNVTSEAELAALAWVDERVAGPVEADAQFAPILDFYFAHPASQGAGAALRVGRPEAATVVSEKWADWGVVRWPLAPTRVWEPTADAFAATGNAVYASGEVVVVLPSAVTA